MVFLLRAVSDQPETANHLTNSEETNHLGGNDSDRCPLCARHASYLVEHVERLGGGGLSRGENASRVASDVEDGLEVALEGGHVSGSQISMIVAVWCCND